MGRLKKVGCAAAVLVVVTACGFDRGLAPAANRSPAGPTASPATEATVPSATAASPPPTSPRYAVLVDLLSDPMRYTVSVVGATGQLWSTFTVAQRTGIATARGHAVTLPYISTTSSALYYLDGDSKVVRTGINGQSATVAKLQVGAGMVATFAVRPDERAMAVSVLDFNANPVHAKLYIQPLDGDAPPTVIYESDSNYVWPVAWHSGLLILAHAYGPYEEDIARAAPGRDNPYSALSYHVVDPSTANRVVLMGACTVSGPLTSAGSGCIQGGVIDWTGNVTSWGTQNWGSVSSAAALSPDGEWVAAPYPSDPSRMAIWRPDGGTITWVKGPGSRDWAGWLDQHTIVTGSYTDPNWTAEVVNVISGSGGREYFTPYHGFFAATLPTDLV